MQQGGEEASQTAAALAAQSEDLLAELETSAAARRHLEATAERREADLRRLQVGATSSNLAPYLAPYLAPI